MTLQQILEEVKNGQLSVEHAENLLKKEGYEEMDYAKLDTTEKNGPVLRKWFTVQEKQMNIF